MSQKDIETREDIHLLVSCFYEKVKKDELLGSFFMPIIKDWDAHIERLTQFWETNLFMTKELRDKYYGNPLDVHVKVDHDNNKSITEHHFGVWLNLWFQTIDELFKGDVADKAKRRARKMSMFLYLKIFEARY